MKKMMGAILAVFLVCSLTGCMNMQVEEKISRSGEVIDTAVVYLEKASVVDYVNRKFGSDNMAEVEKQILESGSTLQNVDGKEYYVSKPQVEKSTIAKTAKQNQAEAVKGSYQLWETGLRLDLKAGLRNALGEDEDLDLSDKEAKELLATSFIEYSIQFDYDIVKVDAKGTIDSQNPKKATWKIPFNNIDKAPVIEAYCKSDIKVSGVKQGATYKKAKKVAFSGTTSATYKGKKVKSGTKFKKHGQHTLILKAASGEQRTVTFFVDKKKPVVKGVKNKKTYKKAKYFTVLDNDSGVASVKINGKKQKLNKSSYALVKKGTYHIVVKDKVGNKTKVKVKITKNNNRK